MRNFKTLHHAVVSPDPQKGEGQYDDVVMIITRIIKPGKQAMPHKIPSEVASDETK